MYAFYACVSEQVETVGETIQFVENHPFYTGLYDQLAAFQTRRSCNVKRGTLAGIAAAGNFGDCISLRMKHIGLCGAVLVLAYIGKTGRCAIVSVGDYHLVFYQKRAYLPAATI